MREIEDFDSSTAAAWRRFQARLADHLAEMEEDDLLLLENESSLGNDDGAAPYVQFCAWGPGKLRCEAVSNHYLAPGLRLDAAADGTLTALGFAPPTCEPEAVTGSGSANYWVDAGTTDADRLAVMATRALRDVYGVTDPAFLTGHPFGEVQTESSASAVPTPPSDEEPAVYPSGGAEHLRRLVDEALTPGMGHVPVRDEDGDIPIDCGAVVVFVRVLDDRPVVRLFACVASEVSDTRRAAFEVAVLNRDRLFFKFVLGGDAVFMQTDIVAWPFAPAHLRDLLDLMCRNVEQIHDDLAARLSGGEDGGSVAAAPEPPSQEDQLHPAMRTLLQLDADEPGSVDPRLAASICDHDRDLILTLLNWSEQQEIAWRQAVEEALLEDDEGLVGVCEGELDQARRTTKLLRRALRVTVERHARTVDPEVPSPRHRRAQRSGSSRRRVPDPTIEEIDPDMWG